jgi:hypothetical protein
MRTRRHTIGAKRVCLAVTRRYGTALIIAGLILIGLS